MIGFVTSAVFLFLAVFPLLVHAHPEEIVESIQDARNRERAMPREAERYGSPLWEIEAKVPFIGSPVHENMMATSVNLSNVHGREYKVDYDEAYIRGVFWNDDPEDLLCPRCSMANLLEFDRRWGGKFAIRFRNAEKLARSTGGKSGRLFAKGDGLLERSHFGDLQFLHGMAAKDGERADETQKKILKWAEFVYKVATGEISQKFSLAQIPLPEVRDLFKGDPALESKTIEQLFMGTKFAKRVAIGTLLHMIQDSFAPGHAEREILEQDRSNGNKIFLRGKVKEFHSYTNQDSSIHAQDDKWPNGLEPPFSDTDQNPISIGSQVLKLLYANNGEGVPWFEVERYLREVVFAIDDGDTPASPGEKYRRKSEH